MRAADLTLLLVAGGVIYLLVTDREKPASPVGATTTARSDGGTDLSRTVDAVGKATSDFIAALDKLFG